MRNAMAMTIVLALAAGVLAEAAQAATVEKITPSKGQVGQTAIIHGSGFSAGPVVVKFGRVAAREVTTLNEKKIKVIVPEKHALDPNPVQATVTVAGQTASGDVEFLYDPPGPAPVIESVEPKSANRGQPFTIMVTGTHFATPQGREPSQIWLVGPQTIGGTVVNIESATRFTAEFPPVDIAGSYTIVAGFSDGTGATAEGFGVD